MPTWNELNEQIRSNNRNYDELRAQLIAQLSNITGRNVIVYYSGFLQKPDLYNSYPTTFSINDNDMNGLMANIHQLNTDLGLDIVLQTPGGNIAATEAIVSYLRSKFGTNIRAIVPQLAMSAGTMIACATEEIVMGKHSSIGPIDPQLNGLAAHGILEEIRKMNNELTPNPTTGEINPAKIIIWREILSKYYPSLIVECENSIALSNEMVKQWLISGMFAGLPDAKRKAQKVLRVLTDHNLTKTHSRHLDVNRAEEIGLKIVRLEGNQDLQEAVLSVHHICSITLADTSTTKIIQNQIGAIVTRDMGNIPPDES